MKKVLSGVLAIGFVLALGLNMAYAQARPPAGGMAGDMPGRCGDMMGPGVMGSPMPGRCGGMPGPGMMRSPMTGRCGCGMARHMTRGKMGMEGIHHRLWHYMMGLGLDQKQMAEMKKIKTDLMKKMIRKKADLRIAMLELGDLVHAEKIDMKKVEAKVKEAEGLRSSMLLSGIEALEAAKSKLTAEQRKKLEDMRQSPVRCPMMGDDMMSGNISGDDDMMEEGMMGEMPSSSAEDTMEEAPEGNN